MDALQIYRRDITRIKPTTKEELNALALRAQSGDDDARSRIMEGLQPLVFRMACRFSTDHHLRLDAISQATLAIVDAIKFWKPQKGDFFMKAAYTIRGRLSKWREVDHVIRQPRTRGHAPRPTVSFSEPVPRARGTFGDTIPATSADPALEAERREEDERIASALRALKPRNLELLQLRAEGKSQADLARQWGVTRQSVKLREYKAMARLRELLGVEGVTLTLGHAENGRRRLWGRGRELMDEFGITDLPIADMERLRDALTYELSDRRARAAVEAA